jgi:hypothetical protein
MNQKRLYAGISAVAWLATTCNAAIASEFQALCGGVKCTVTITPELISSPYGQMPPSRVTYWGSSGDSKTSVGTGVATTILFGGIGLLGFLAKNHQYNFTINGFDAEGKKASMQIEFKNDKPAKLMMSELTAFTGIGMGQTRSAEEILAAEKGQEPTLENIGKQSGATILGPKGAKKEEVVKKNCWSTYLEDNPAMKKWAEANPAQASQNKKKFNDC